MLLIKGLLLNPGFKQLEWADENWQSAMLLNDNEKYGATPKTHLLFLKKKATKIAR